MVKMRGAGALLFVLFLDCWQCADMRLPFPRVEGTVTGILLGQMEKWETHCESPGGPGVVNLEPLITPNLP